MQRRRSRMKAGLHWVQLLSLLSSILPAFAADHNSSTDEQTWKLEAVMPEHPAPPETYLCMRVDLPDVNSLKLTGIEPLSHEALVHHMLLFGCSSRTDENGVWSCQGHGVCPSGGTQQILYGWAKGAPAMHLPEGVGYKVGKGTKINNLVLQVHYAVERPKGDVSGINLALTTGHVPFSAGMMMFASSFQIPPKQEKHLVPNRCCYSGFEPAHGFAFRVHTHMLGRSVYLDETPTVGDRRRIVEHSPQLPQGFTSVSETVFWPGQRLEATCQFDSMEREDVTWAGATHHHEMCNLYMIMWSELPVFINCYDSYTSVDYHGAGGIPESGELVREEASIWRPLQAPKSQPGSHQGDDSFGQVAGVGKGLNGSVWVFHRGDRVWDLKSFTGSRGEHTTYTEPIKEKTVFQLDQDTGEVLASWGSETFFMPHMITVDRWGYVWLTDVGLHQVFKYSPSGKLLLTLGQRLKPGNGSSFCKPTQVAVSNNGTVYVSDGYCNSRVAQFSLQGEHQGDFKLNQGSMNVPHSLVLQECSDLLAVADRENSKVHQFELSTRNYKASWDLKEEGLVFGLSSGPYGTIFALIWDRDRRLGGQSKLLLLHADPGAGIEQRWTLDKVDAPHDLAIVAAPIRLAGSERPLAILIAETKASGSQLQKFTLMPSGILGSLIEAFEAGTPDIAVPGGTELPSASKQWQAVLQSSVPTQEEEIPPQIMAAKTEDVRHSQVLTDEASTADAHHGHSDWSTVQERGKDLSQPFSAPAHGGGRLPAREERVAARQTMLIGVPLLGCVGAIIVAYKRFSAR